jgi:hypothetical protein
MARKKGRFYQSFRLIRTTVRDSSTTTGHSVQTGERCAVEEVAL